MEEKQLNENEQAAIAGKLWKPFSQASWGEWRDQWGNLAPDMRDPAAQYQAIQLAGDSILISRDWGAKDWRVEIYLNYGKSNIVEDHAYLSVAIFKSLVRLYEWDNRAR